MRITLPTVHGSTPGERLLRALALVLVFAVVVWAFVKNSERVAETLNRQSAVYDETGGLGAEDRDFLAAYGRVLREEFGLECRVQVFAGDFVVPELDAKTIYIGLAPAIGAVEARFPALVAQALGPDVIQALRQELLAALSSGEWPARLRSVLLAILERLRRIEAGDRGGE